MAEPEPRSNYTPAERRALEFFRSEYFGHQPDVSLDYVAKWVLRAALANPLPVAASLDSILQYANAEGVPIPDLAEARIADQPEYGPCVKITPNESGSKTG